MPQWHNLLLRLEYDYNRLTEKNSFAAFFQNHAIIIDAGIPFQFGRAQTLTLGADLNISIAAEESGQAPNINAISAQRSDYAVYLGYSAVLTRSFFVNAVGTLVVRQYYEGGRDDISEILALTANYRLNKYLTVSAVSTLRSKPIQPKRFRLSSGQPWWRGGLSGEVLDSSIPIPDNPNTPTE